MIFILGIAGGIMVLIAFFLTNWSAYSNDKFIWDEWLNFMGSVLLLIYALNGEVWPFVILNLVWAAWSIYKLFSFYKIKK